MSRQIMAGTIDVSVTLRIVDAVDGTPETAVVFNTAGIDLQYRRELAASVAITEATLAALTTAHADGGFLHVGNGYYRLDLPDAACAAGAVGVLIHGTVTGMVVLGEYIELVAYDPYDAATLGLSNLNATVSSRSTQTSVDAIGTAVDTEVDAIKAKTDQLTFTTANKLDATIQAAGDFSQAAADKVWASTTRTLSAFSTALAVSVWDVLEAAIVVASSIGLKVKTNLDATVSSRSTYAGADTAGTTTLLSRIIGTLAAGTHQPQSGDSFARLGAPAGASVSVDIAVIEAQVDDIGAAGVGLTAIPSIVTVTGNVNGSVGSIAANGISATSIATGAFTAAKFAAGAFDAVWTVTTRELTAFSTALALSVWHVLEAAIVTASTIGLKVKTNLDATISSRSTYAGADTAGTTTLLARIIGTLAAGTHQPQSGDSFARLGAPAGASVSADIATRLAPTVAGRTLDVSATGEAGVDWANIGAPTTAQNLSGTNIAVNQVVASVSGNVSGAVGSIGANGITSASFTAGAIDATALATDAITNAELSASAVTEIQAGLATAAALTTAQTDLDDIQTRLPAALISGRMVCDVEAINDSLEAAQDLRLSASTIVRGAAVSGTLSTTQMTTDVTEATDDHYKGRILIWTSGTLKDQASDVSSYLGTTKRFTYTATTEAPVAGDTFVLV